MFLGIYLKAKVEIPQQDEDYFINLKTLTQLIFQIIDM